jgi:hypothetical protein
MKISFFPSSQPQRRKNDGVISFITNDLGSANTFPTPQNSSCPRPAGLAAGRRSKRHDA